MMADINHNKSQALWDPEVFYESSKKEKITFWPILVMKLWFCWFIYLMNTYCVQDMWWHLGDWQRCICHKLYIQENCD